MLALVNGGESVGGQAPAALTDLVANSVTEGNRRNRTVVSTILTWSDNSNNEDRFEIESCVEAGKGRDKTCDFSSEFSVDKAFTTWTDSNPADGKKYRVRAVNEAGHSDWSNIANG